MFGPLGVPEVIFILVLALLIFGPRRLPEIGRTLGKAMGEFRRATTELKRSINTEIALEDEDDRPKYTRTARQTVENPDHEIGVSTEGLQMGGRTQARGEGGEAVGVGAVGVGAPENAEETDSPDAAPDGETVAQDASAEQEPTSDGDAEDVPPPIS
jgi:TatA/E family protein of Tat protein translocase